MKQFISRVDDRIVCQFCQALCTQHMNGNNCIWWKCKQCMVEFLVSTQEDTKDLIYEMYFTSKKENNVYYTAQVFLIDETTEISTIKYNGIKNGIISSKINQIINFTPANFQSKIKTILIFL